MADDAARRIAKRLAQPTLTPGPAPTGRDKVFDTVYGWMGGKPANRWAADKITDVATLGGMAPWTAAYDGAREMAETGRPAALATAIMPGARVMAPVAKLAEKAAEKGIKAFHVSPHDFDKFDISKVGSGIGSTTEGHGLYFTTSPKLIDEYAKGMENPKRYEVMINADGKKFLDYDELERAGMHETVTSPDFARAALKTNVGGLKAKNTGAGYEGTENFTVFDDSLIEILRKYGLLPPAAVGGVAASQSDPAQASP